MRQGKLAKTKALCLTLCLALALALASGLYLIDKLAFAQTTQANSRYFPETNHTVTGRFLDYWQSNGDLMQQGYPISEEMQEVSEIDGKTYRVQYFERAMFEYHPENTYPYDVLLTLLGRLRYTEKYPNSTPAPDQKPNESQGSIFFPETGKRLGGSFLLYWKQFGGLKQQGYPVSDEIQERSELDGKTYTVQYFERSVMEWHPGNTPPYDVPLSQLGKFHYDEKYGGVSHALGDPQLIARAVPGRPVGAGHRIFYLRYNNPNPAPYDPHNTLYGYDLQQNKEFLVSDTPGNKANLVTDGTYVVWTENSGEGPTERPQSLYAYNVQTDKTSMVLTATITVDAFFRETALDSGILYYQDGTPGHTGLFARTLATNNERLISEQGFEPVVGAGAIVWGEHHSKSPSEGWSLHLSKLDGSITNRVITETVKFFSGYDVSGSNVVWGFGAQVFPLDIYLYNSDDNSTTLIGKEGVYPAISGNKAAWTAGGVRTVHGGDTNTSIMMYDLNTRTTSTVVESSGWRPLVVDVIGGNILLYTIASDKYLSVRDFYICNLGCPCNP